MAKRKINWTEKANFERKEILDYWIRRNKSKNYSIKLNKLFIETLKQVYETIKNGTENTQRIMKEQADTNAQNTKELEKMKVEIRSGSLTALQAPGV